MDNSIESRVREYRRVLERNSPAPNYSHVYLRNLNQVFGSLAVDAELRKQFDEEKTDGISTGP